MDSCVDRQAIDKHVEWVALEIMRGWRTDESAALRVVVDLPLTTGTRKAGSNSSD
jgi:hypothetical protein